MPPKGVDVSKRYVVDEDAYKTALEAYCAINYSLTAQGITPGYLTAKGGKLVLRGEFVDVPRRFLDTSQKADAWGSLDDRAHEFEAYGIEDGDALLAWMKNARRPLKRDFRIEIAEPSGSRERMARKRAKREDGKCVVCTKEPAREGRSTCEWCSAAAAIRMARRRERAKALAAEREIFEEAS